MQKYTFSHSDSSLKDIVIGLIISALTLFIFFWIAEWYFTWYYQQAKHTAQTAMNLPIYQASEYRSWDHKPNTHIESAGNTIDINSQGLRGDEIPVEKTKNRYLLLGDSFTFGMGVDQNESFPEQLQSALGKYHRVMNAGVIGQTIDDAYLYLKYEGIKLQPDYVIYNFFVGNDITELRRHIWTEKNNELIKTSDSLLTVSEENTLKHRESKEPDSYFLFWLSQKMTALKGKYGLNETAFDPTLTWPVFLSDDHPAQDPEILSYWIEFEEVLKQMKNYCDENGIIFIVNIIPMDTQVSKSYWKKYPGTPFDNDAFEKQRPQKHLAIIAEKYSIPLIDALELLQSKEEQGIRTYFKNDPHFTPQGHRFTAGAIWEFLINNYL